MSEVVLCPGELGHPRHCSVAARPEQCLAVVGGSRSKARRGDPGDAQPAVGGTRLPISQVLVAAIRFSQWSEVASFGIRSKTKNSAISFGWISPTSRDSIFGGHRLTDLKAEREGPGPSAGSDPVSASIETAAGSTGNGGWDDLLNHSPTIKSTGSSSRSHHRQFVQG